MRTDVASGLNPATPVWLIERLSHDAAERVRIHAIFSGRLSARTLQRMTADPSPLVRCYASHPARS